MDRFEATQEQAGRFGSRVLRALAAALLALTLAVGLAGCSPDDGASRDGSAAQQSQAAESDQDGAAQDEGGSDDGGQGAAPAAASYQQPSGSSFEVTFLDVGQGDSAVVECDGHYLLIDGGPSDASSLLYSYVKRNDIPGFDAVVATHPDTDHVGGIPGALEATTTKAAYCSVTDADKRAFNAMKDRLGAQNVQIKVPQVGEAWNLGSARVEVIGPVTRTDGDGDANNDSIMLKITYGNTVFVFTGDADQDEERGSTQFLDGCDVLKVAHHGSSGSSGYAFLRAANPKNVVISCGSGNSYGHPTEEALSRLRDVGAAIYRTDLQGDIKATSDGTTVTMSVAKNSDADVLAPGGTSGGQGGQARSGSGQSSGSQASAAQTSNTQSSGGYIGNKNSHKFHSPSCSTLPKPKNQVLFDTREEAVNAGYTPCGRCNP